MPTYIKIEAGDFGEVYTMALMYHEDNYNVESLVDTFMVNITPSNKRLYNIKTSKKECSVNGLPYKDLNDYSNSFIPFLKKRGFKNLFENAVNVAFND